MKRGFEQILPRWWMEVLCFPQRPYSQRPGVHESMETQVSPHHGRKSYSVTDYRIKKKHRQTHTLLSVYFLYVY